MPESPIILTGNSVIPGYEPELISDFKANTFWRVHSHLVYARFIFENLKLSANSIVMGSFTNVAMAPRSFDFYRYRYSVSSTANPSDETRIREEKSYVGSYSQINWQTSPYIHFPFYLNQENHYSFYVDFESTNSDEFSLSEFYFEVCRVPSDLRFSYSQSEFSLILYQTSISVYPIYRGYSKCSVNPSLPKGLWIDSTLCTINGIPREVSSKTTYTIQSSNPIANTEIQLEIKPCRLNSIQVMRRYGDFEVQKEWFRIEDADTSEVILEEAPYSGQEELDSQRYQICVKSERVRVTVGRIARIYWSTGSIITIYDTINSQYHELARLRYDVLTGIPSTITLALTYSLPPQGLWSYKYGIVPEGWNTETQPSWLTSSRDTFPLSFDSVALFVREFEVSSVEESSLYELGVLFVEGCVVYLNGVEIYRYRVEGNITSTSVATGCYSAARYRWITLPVYSLTYSRRILHAGKNLISIALVSRSPGAHNVIFDALLRLLGNQSQNRLLSCTFQSSSFDNVSYAVDNDANTDITFTEGDSGSVVIEFDEFRQESIGAVLLVASYSLNRQSPSALRIEAKNSEEPWTEIVFLSPIFFYYRGSMCRVYFTPSLPYSSFRFTFYASSNETAIALAEIGLFSAPHKSLDYHPVYNYKELYVGVDVGVLLPDYGQFFLNYTALSPLPEGLHLDALTGSIFGTPQIVGPFSIPINAWWYEGESVRIVFEGEIVSCPSQNRLVWIIFRTDYNSENLSFTLSDGSSILLQRDVFEFRQMTYQFVLCLPQQIYELTVVSTYPEGMAYPGSVAVAVGRKENRVIIDEIHHGNQHSVTETHTFSNVIPFMMGSTEWSLFLSRMKEDWISPFYDDSHWEKGAISKLNQTTTRTVYARFSMPTPSINDYAAIQFYGRFNGGVVAYFNGRMIARYGLPGVYDSETLADNYHDRSERTCFYVNLLQVQLENEKSVFAVELHRPKGMSSGMKLRMDFEAVLLADTVCMVKNTLSRIVSSESDNKKYLFDTDIYTSSTLSLKEGNSFSWEYENLIGSLFDGYAFHSLYSITNLTWTIYGKRKPEDTWMMIDKVVQGTFLEQQTTYFPFPQGLLGFTALTFQLDSSSNPVQEGESRIAEFFTIIYNSRGQICQQDGDWPAVGEGSLSPGECDSNHYGYSYRKCVNGTLGPIQYDKCKPYKPAKLVYPVTSNSIAVRIPMKSLTPSFEHIISRFHIHPRLPTGIEFDTETGTISGTPLSLMDFRTYTIYGENENGATFFVLEMEVREGKCPSMDDFPETVVGNVYIYDCSKRPGYYGVIRRRCKEGAHDGEWGFPWGMCVSGSTLILCIGVVVIILILIGYTLYYISARYKNTHNRRQQNALYPSSISRRFSGNEYLLAQRRSVESDTSISETHTIDGVSSIRMRH